MRQMCLQKMGEVVRGLQVDTGAEPECRGSGQAGLPGTTALAGEAEPSCLLREGSLCGQAAVAGLGGPIPGLRPPQEVNHVPLQEGNEIDELAPLLFLRVFFFILKIELLFVSI